MRIAGFQKNSFVDFRGKVASTVFTPLCNFNCYYCHNSHLLERDKSLIKYEKIHEKAVFEHLEKRKGLIQGVVVTGGEPTLQKDLSDFLGKVKDMGYLTKLDSNGYNPEIIQELIKNNLLDSISMDIKAPYDKYDSICSVKLDIKRIEQSINIIKNSNIDYEFRTTVVPEFTMDDITNMAKMIEKSKLYTLQQFRKPKWEDRLVDIRNAYKPHTSEFFHKAKDICEKYIDKVELRGVPI